MKPPPPAGFSGEERPSRELEQLARRVSILELVDAAITRPGRAGTARTDCPHCVAVSGCVVSDSQWRCDHCESQGGPIEFVMARRRLPWSRAIPELFKHAQLADAASAWSDRVTEAQIACDVARKWFRAQFAASAAARAYWESRGFSMASAEREDIGYAPQGTAPLLEGLHATRVSNRAALDAGLLKLGVGTSLQARFRDRVMFPISDSDDMHAVAFGGRAIEAADATPTARRRPKYLNSPETILWSKGSSLFGYGSARDAIQRARTAVLVEGYLHRLRVLEAGVPHVVASCGTSLTSGQAEQIATAVRGPGERKSGTVIVLYDEGAGAQALHAAALLGTIGLCALIGRLPPGSDDPDSFGRRACCDALRYVIESAVPPWVAAYAAEAGDDEAVLPLPRRAQVLRHLCEMASAHPSSRARRALGEFVSSRFGVPQSMVEEQLARVAVPTGKHAPAPR
ncbi:MAG TPA: hypothetical protein VHE78_11255 [Gemmatimonadaceae bacterium]|nr:hypothetical protein [Gemmatimonadaceae bacterium]